MNTLTEIKTLFETIAATLPDIGHNPDAGIHAFYGYNNDEALSTEGITLAAKRMGLSLNTHTGLSGNYQAASSAMNDTLSIEVAIVECITDVGDFQGEYAIYDWTKRNLDYIVDWLLKASNTGKLREFGIDDLFDLTTVPHRRIGPVHSNCYGWAMSIPITGTICPSGNNPLNNMQP